VAGRNIICAMQHNRKRIGLVCQMSIRNRVHLKLGQDAVGAVSYRTTVTAEAVARDDVRYGNRTYESGAPPR
jgi:hypothetical protein